MQASIIKKENILNSAILQNYVRMCVLFSNNSYKIMLSIANYTPSGLYELSRQFFHKLREDMRMMIDISLGVLDRYGPLVIKARRKEDASICQKKPVGIGEAHIDVPPGSTVVAGTGVAEHCTTLCTYLNHVH